MILETIQSRGLAHLSYLLGDENEGVCAVIDPRRDVSAYVDLARQHHCRITQVFETHIHADFVSGGPELAALTGAQLIGGVSPEYAPDVHQASEGESFQLGALTLRVIHTPGHTPEHISLLVQGGKGSEAPWGIFTGDTLFAGEVGRPDLLGGGSELGLAAQLYHSLQEKLFTLGDQVEIYPAHGQGSPCGGSIGDRNTSTIGYERMHLPKAHIKTESEFVREVLTGLPPAPSYYPRMKKVNAAGARILGCISAIQPLSASAFEAAASRPEALIVDAREIESFAGAHIAGALNIPLRDEFPVWSGWMLKPETEILLVVDNEQQVDVIQRHLLRIGIENIRGYLRQGMRGWLESGREFKTLNLVPVSHLEAGLSPETQILDVRTDGEWEAGHVPGAQHVFVPQLEAKLKTLDPSRPTVVYCGSGYRASIAASLLKSRGFHSVANVPGGMKAWKSAGYTTTTN